MLKLHLPLSIHLVTAEVKRNIGQRIQKHYLIFSKNQYATSNTQDYKPYQPRIDPHFTVNWKTHERQTVTDIRKKETT